MITLLRHGQVEGEDVFRGSTDTPLSEAGWNQMNNSIGNDDDYHVIVSSPLLRCQAFAESLLNKEERQLISDERIQEINFGVWEACSPDDIMQKDAERLQEWWNNPTAVTPPQGESFQHFRYRVLDCWQEAIRTHKGKNLLFVTHAGVIRIILMKILGMQEENLFRIDVDYSNLSRIRIHHDETGDWASLISHG